jgi:hypothetical protein
MTAAFPRRWDALRARERDNGRLRARRGLRGLDAVCSGTGTRRRPAAWTGERADERADEATAAEGRLAVSIDQ